jgi:hypothetical protein
MTQRQRRTATALCAFVLAALATGCATVYPLGPTTYIPRPASTVAGLLVAESDEAEEIIPHLMRPEPLPDRQQSEPPQRAHRFGLRAGYMIAAESKRGTWDPAPRNGVYYWRRSGAVFEFGIDAASVEGQFGDAGLVVSSLLFGRFDVLVGAWEKPGAGSRFYVVAGAEVGKEEATWDASGETTSRTAGALNVGCGLSARSGFWDARVVYSIYLGTDGGNVPGSGLAAIGVSF